MNVLQDYIKKKEALLNIKFNSQQFHKDILNDNNDIDEKKANKIAKNEGEIFKRKIILLNNENLFDKIEYLLSKEKITEGHKNKIKNLFFKFAEYLISKRTKSNIYKANLNSKKILSLKRINISDSYNFIKYKTRYKKESSIKFILSLMRKYIRLLNNEPKLNFKQRISQFVFCALLTISNAVP
ncbi:hypothetical protein IJ707_03425 [bacterium]|nr:hypothetical protein [bacterium]